MRVLVTRPLPQAAKTAATLCQCGHEPTVAPLMRTEHRLISAGAFGEVDALIVTSPRALPAMAEAPRELPVFTTGSETAQHARDGGFARVESGDADWRALATTIVASPWLRPGACLLHVSGARVRGALDEALAEAGLRYTRVIGYRMIDSPKLPDAAGRWLDGEDGAVLFYSPASGALWYQLANANRDALQRHTAICISSACAAALGDLPWLRCAIAARPTETSVLAALETLS